MKKLISFPPYRRLTITFKLAVIVLIFCYQPASFSSSSSLQRQLQSYLDNIASQKNIVAVSCSIDTLPLKSNFHSGYYSTKKRRRVNKKTLFGVGSITKTFVSVKILQLEAEGRLNINDPISKYFPEWKKWGQITIKQLLNMSSGVFNYFEDKQYDLDLSRGFNHSWSTDSLIHLAYQHKLYFTPGLGWHYSDTNYLILGKIIEKVSNASLDSEIHHIIEQNHLKNTFFTTQSYPQSIMKKVALGYFKGHPLNPDSAHNIGGAAASMIMSSHDLKEWTDDLFKRKTVLPQKQLDEMKQGISIPINYENSHLINTTYGLGIPITHSTQYGTVVWYAGVTPWHTSVFIYIPLYEIQITIECSFDKERSTDDDMLFINNTIIKNILNILTKGN